MRSRTLIVLFACVIAYPLLTGAQVAPSKGGEDVSGPYEPDPNWPQPISPDLTWGRTGAVFAESPDRVFVMQSGLVPWTWKRLQGPALGGGTLLHSANNGRIAHPLWCVNPIARRAGFRWPRSPGSKFRGHDGITS